MLVWIDAEGRARTIAFAILALTFVGLMLYGVETNWFPWSNECQETPSCDLLVGEQFAAIEHAWGNLYDGPSSWLLYRHGYDLYIHNSNFGAQVIYLTAWLGADSIAAASILSATGFVMGLGYGYLLVERLSRSRLLALTFLLLFVLDLRSNTAIGLNVLRAWHWLPLFGVPYHALSLHIPARARRSQIIIVLLLAMVGFNIGYEFYAFVVATTAVVVALAGRRTAYRRWLLLAALLIVPFIVRQLQVIGAVGVSLWSTDLYYTAGMKSPFFRTILPLPPVDDVLAWYKDHGFIHGEPNQQSMAYGFAQFVANDRADYWLHEFGYLTVAAALIGCALSTWLFLFRRSTLDGWCARAPAAINAGQVLGFLIFGYHALRYFLVQFSMPMIVVPVQLSAAFVITYLLLPSRSSTTRLVGLVVAAVLFAERILVSTTAIAAMAIRARPPDKNWGTVAFVPPGGMYGEIGWVPFLLAAAVGAWCLWLVARAFLRCDPSLPVYTPEPEYEPASAGPALLQMSASQAPSD